MFVLPNRSSFPPLSKNPAAADYHSDLRADAPTVKPVHFWKGRLVAHPVFSFRPSFPQCACIYLRSIIGSAGAEALSAGPNPAGDDVRVAPVRESRTSPLILAEQGERVRDRALDGPPQIDAQKPHRRPAPAWGHLTGCNSPTVRPF